MQQLEEVSNLASFLRNNGDIVLKGKCKLSLTSSILHTLNDSFANILNNEELFISSFYVLNSTGEMLDTFLDLHFLYEFFKKTVGLKLIPSNCGSEQKQADIHIFRDLKLLEVQRLSLNLIKGIKSLRAQLQYLTCMRSLSALNEVLENCGGDQSQGFVWSELKAASFCHNDLKTVDNSFEFTPNLETLDLSYNNIENVQHINCLSNLQFLNLSFNKIQILPGFTGKICETLQILVIRHNFIDDINELNLLTNLRKLDVAYNLLLNHGALMALSNMTKLECLCLEGNPLFYQKQHRINAVKYLHSNVARNNFKLDNFVLTKTELRMVASVQVSNCSFERSSSINSVTTANTVIQVQPINQLLRNPVVFDNVQTSDMEVSVTSLLTQESDKRIDSWNRVFNLNDTSMYDSQGMQDSGIVARPASPSECSIGKDR